jgi:hypothetical protein
MAGRKQKQEEKLDPSNIERVIGLLSGGSPITKKAACEILNISYNTARLTKLIEDYKAKKKKDAEMRSEKRGKPATEQEVGFIISSYLTGSSVEHISSSLYRGTDFINSVLERYHVPRRSRSYNYFRPEVVPEGAMRDRFKVGDLVYSMQYDSLAKIEAEMPHPVYGFAYRIWLKDEKWKQFAYSAACELASLDHIKNYV